MTMRIHEGVFSNHPGRRLAVGGFTFSDATYAGGEAIPWHTHDRATVRFVVEGSLQEGIGVTDFRCSKYDVTFKPAGALHRDVYGPEGARCLVIEIQEDKLVQLAPDWSRPLYIGGGALAAACLRIHRELLCADQYSAMALEGLVLTVLADMARMAPLTVSSPRPRWLTAAKEVLNRRFAEEVSLADVAAQVGVHRVHLAYAFRRAFGRTPGEYLRTIRVEEARRQLLQTRRPLSQIALECGFYDQSHFTKTFKRYTGMTPSHLRQMSGLDVDAAAC